MDKKPNFYSRQGSSKTLLSESRKSSDLYSSKQWPRNARRRENPNQTNSKADPQRSGKPGSAKTRPNVDKRPKPRGGYGSNPFAVSTSSSGLAMDDAVTDSGNLDFEVELNSIYAPGSKKQNLNHLLNFHYGSREFEASNMTNVFSRGGNRTVTKKHKYNKEQFLQANFQFVIKSGENTPSIISSPDTLVNWDLIEQINIQTTEEPQCPICLYPPIAAKLTRCGHAYCWPCILHYLALSDKTWRKCPICYDAIHVADLKSTSIVQLTNFIVGSDITLHLMRRKQDSLFIEKVENYPQFDENIPHLRDDEDKKKFSKILLADSYEILSIIERERSELIASDDPDCPESIFMQQALTLLLERKSNILKEIGKNGKAVPDSVEKFKTDVAIEAVPAQELVEEVEDESKSSVTCKESTSPINDIKYYYFYQSNDGQNIYLHALNVKILQAMYGSLEQSPTIINAKIVQKETHSMDENLRKRLRYLQHLPLTCQFDVVEVQFEPPLISSEILDKFKDEIILRHKTRMRRAREERKRERQINEINDRQMGRIIARTANIDITSSQQFPLCGFDDFLSGNSPSDPALTFTSDLISSPSTSSIPPSNGPSFAKMLSSPKKELWPSLDRGSNQSIGETSAASWSRTSVSRNIDRLSESETFNDPNGDAAHYAKQNFGDFIVKALQQKKTTAHEKDTAGSSGMSSKKTKKNKKTLLFSTGINFNGN